MAAPKRLVPEPPVDKLKSNSRNKVKTEYYDYASNRLNSPKPGAANKSKATLYNKKVYGEANPVDERIAVRRGTAVPATPRGRITSGTRVDPRMNPPRPRPTGSSRPPVAVPRPRVAPKGKYAK